MDLKTRKRLSLLILVLGLPGYIVVVWVLLAWLGDTFGDGAGRLPFLIELVVIVGLGIVWIVPLKRIFTGIGKDGE